jgi:hypothetical protein
MEAMNMLLRGQPIYTGLKFVFTLAVICALTTGASSTGAEFQYSRTRELPPLKLSYEELSRLLEKAHNLLSTANAQADKREYLREKITLAAGSDKIEISGFALDSTTRLPKAAYSFSYSYYWSDAPLSSFQMDFGDYSRRITVSGTEGDQVEAICSALERDCLEHSVFIGGSLFRALAGNFLLIGLIVSLTLTAAYCIVERRWRALGMPLCSLIALVMLLTLPFEELLAGFAVYRGNASFLVRYGPQLSFLGVIVSIVGIPLSYFLPRLSRDST